MTAPDPTAGERVTPCRYSATRDRWESITWPGKPTAYPCAHNHAHCDAMGCVGHVDGMHTDARGDVISHIGCDLCCPASPPAFAASTGTSEDVEALTDERREALGNWLRARGVYSFGLLCDIADWCSREIATREAAARAEERERIAQAIEADGPPADYPGGTVAGRAYARAARIAREGRT